ncbi:hypothetical protein JMG10_24800 [Nostoc ellipsosporum NOK]|uniref:hypothetical protein n=1 Tax=Sphingomonas sp. IBVSS2 TaxID=1985172 RepID=UPI000A2D72A6|nr:hypothetical protein [Sphingomonas sp. IBVSS2]MDF2384715.1 hypothetical protein [Nostoc ellipsosporum NOK]OSZ63049.1 hypothetical protein CAP40_18500 [Sphingomonas sp. IBVSS2]
MSAAGQGLPVSPELFAALFLLVFPFFWLAIIALVANQGWRKVARAYPATSDPPYSARRWRFVSLNIGGSLRSPNYASSVQGWTSESGFWLRPFLLFRPFHPTIHVPWTGVESVERERRLVGERVRVKLAGEVPDLLFVGALGHALLERQRDKTGSAKGQ